MRTSLAPVDEFETEYLIHPPRPLFPDVQTQIGSGGISLIFALQAIYPTPGDLSFEFYRMIQNQRGNFKTANLDFRSFIDVIVGSGKFVDGNDLRIFTAPDVGSPVSVPFHLVKFNAANGRAQFYLNPATISDLDVCQMTYKKASESNASNPNAVWDSKYNLAYIFEGDTDTTFTDQTSNGNDGTGTTGELVTGLRGLKAYDTKGFNGAEIVIPDSSTVDLGTGNFTISFFMQTTDMTSNFFELVGKKAGVNGNLVGIMLLYDSRVTDAFRIRVNDGTQGSDEEQGVSNTRDILRDGNFHYVSFSLNNTTHVYELSIDGVVAGGGTLTLTGNLSNTEPLELSHNIGGGVLNMRYQNFTISNEIRNLEDIKATSENMLNYDKVIRTTSLDLPTAADTQFFVGISDMENWFNIFFAKRILFNINSGQVPSTQTDFPLLINSIIPDLIGNTQVNGEDIRFTLADMTELKYEIEKFDSLTGEIIAWVKIPSLQTGTEIFMYYDNPDATDNQDAANVYDSNFLGVWHNNKISPNVPDSTSNNNDGTPTGGIAVVAGQIGDALDFKATPESVSITPTISTGTSISVSVWINFPVGNPLAMIFMKDPVNAEWELFLEAGQLKWRGVGADNTTTTPEPSTNNWHLVGATQTGTTSKLYIDGVLKISGTPGAIPNNAGQVNMGKFTNGFFYGGLMDETRLSDIVRSDDWFATDYNNQSNPSAFYSTGSPETFMPTKVIKVIHELPAWKKRIDLTTVASEVLADPDNVDFPLYVEIQDDALKTETKTDGSDILFTDEFGNTIPFIIAKFDRAAGIIKAHMKQTISSSKDVRTHLFFSNPSATDAQNQTGVWTSDVKGVFLFNEGNLPIAGLLLDRSTNPFNPILANTAATVSQTGEVDDAQQMGDGAVFSAYGTVGLANKFKIADKLTIIAVIKTTSPALDGFVNMGATFNNGYLFHIQPGGIPQLNLLTTGGLVNAPSSGAVNDGNFHSLAVTYDRINIKNYTDGLIKTTLAETDAPSYASPDNFTLGAGNITGTFAFGPSGVMDHVIIFDTAKTANFIANIHKSFFNPSTLTTQSGVKDNG